MRIVSFLSAVAAGALGLTASATAQSFGVIPNNGNGNYYPSVSADGNKIAFLTDITSGKTATVKVYNRSAGTTTTCSSGITYVSRPRISRDGTYVTFFGTPDYLSSGSLLTVPMVASTTTGTCVAALARTGSNTTSIWTPLTEDLGKQAPGIQVSSGNWKVSFGDLVARQALPDNEESFIVRAATPRPIWTAFANDFDFCKPSIPLNSKQASFVSEDYCTTAAKKASEVPEWICTADSVDGNATHVYYTPNEQDNETDISDNGVIAFVYGGEVYTGSPQANSPITSTGGKCKYPSIDATGTKVAYESTATSGVLSGSNVKIVTISTATSVTPYAVASGQSNTGSATRPFISSDGSTVAFNCSSSHLNFAYSYSFSGSLTYACQTYTSSGGTATILSADTSSPRVVKSAGNACAFNLTSTFAGCFDTSDTSLTSTWGSYGTGSNVVKVY